MLGEDKEEAERGEKGRNTKQKRDGNGDIALLIGCK